MALALNKSGTQPLLCAQLPGSLVHLLGKENACL
jgi:hypothetical protein